MGQTHRVSGVATTVTGANGTIDVAYHSTRVVSFDDKTITLRTGGWRTVTTKLRMNQAASQFHLGYRVFADKGAWFVTTARGDVLPFTSSELVFTRAGKLVA